MDKEIKILLLFIASILIWTLIVILFSINLLVDFAVNICSIILYIVHDKFYYHVKKG